MRSVVTSVAERGTGPQRAASERYVREQVAAGRLDGALGDELIRLLFPPSMLQGPLGLEKTKALISATLADVIKDHQTFSSTDLRRVALAGIDRWPADPAALQGQAALLARAKDGDAEARQLFADVARAHDKAGRRPLAEHLRDVAGLPSEAPPTAAPPEPQPSLYDKVRAGDAEASRELGQTITNHVRLGKARLAEAMHRNSGLTSASYEPAVALAVCTQAEVAGDRRMTTAYLFEVAMTRFEAGKEMPRDAINAQAVIYDRAEDPDASAAERAEARARARDIIHLHERQGRGPLAAIHRRRLGIND